MSDADKGPREFWILKNPAGYQLMFEPYDLSLGPDQTEIHLIEHSAYVKLQKELDAARAEVDELKSSSMGGALARSISGLANKSDREQVQGEYLRSLQNQLAEAQEQIREYREALKKITSLTNSWVVAEQTINCKHTYGDIRRECKLALKGTGDDT
jgi:hypothetical protein